MTLKSKQPDFIFSSRNWPTTLLYTGSRSPVPVCWKHAVCSW